MPASSAASASRHAPGPLRAADDGVSEVVGQILMFGILSMVLILSLLGFNAAKAGAEGRVAALEAESMAQRVAGVYISASLFAEEYADSDVRYSRVVDLPERVQDRPYLVGVQSENLLLSIDSIGVEVSTSLLSAGAPPELVVCDQSGLEGGPLRVVAEPWDEDINTDGDPDNDQPCGALNDIILYLESA